MTVTDPTLATTLDTTLCDLINLALLAKQAHWNVHGPTFSALHAILDDVAQTARVGSDELAERAMALGHHPDGRAATVVAATVLPDLPIGPIIDTVVIDSFTDILDTMVTRLHKALDDFRADPVTQDVLTGTTRAIEKIAWVIRAHR
jgi:starvation-inducible DNA-binding protein